MKTNHLLVASMAGVVALSAAAFANETTPITSATTQPTPFMMPLMGGGHGPDIMMMKGEGRGKGMKFKANFAAMQKGEQYLLNNDYNGFLTTIKGTPMEGKVTETQFKEMASHAQKRASVEKALEEGDYATFVKVTTPTKEEFTLMSQRAKQMKAARQAVENNDYAAFVAAHKGTPMEGKITETQFTSMVEKMKSVKNAE